MRPEQLAADEVADGPHVAVARAFAAQHRVADDRRKLRRGIKSEDDRFVFGVLQVADQDRQDVELVGIADRPGQLPGAQRQPRRHRDLVVDADCRKHIVLLRLRQVVEAAAGDGQLGRAVAVVEALGVVEAAEAAELFEPAQVVQQRRADGEPGLLRRKRLGRREGRRFVAYPEGVGELQPQIPVQLFVVGIKALRVGDELFFECG